MFFLYTSVNKVSFSLKNVNEFSHRFWRILTGTCSKYLASSSFFSLGSVRVPNYGIFCQWVDGLLSRLTFWTQYIDEEVFL